MMRVMIKRKSFGSKEVLRDISLELQDGSSYIIEGPSGIGKTTLMRILSGLDADFEGSIENPYRSPIVLFQENRLIENLSLISNLRAVSDDTDRIREVLHNLELEGEERSAIATLSGGMKRRAAIARALIRDYDALFLDEPFTGLDESLIDRVAEYIKREAKGRTIIIISHDALDKARFSAIPIVLKKE